MTSLSRLRPAHLLPPRPPLDWILVHGPVRSGTSLMARLIGQTARRSVLDWGLGPMLVGPLGSESRLDLPAARRRLSAQILRDAPRGGGAVVDLVYKQANLTSDEHAALVDMWGPPRRTVFCFRDPAGFIVSARRKFPDVSDERFWNDNYVASLQTHREVGGDTFVYGPGVTLEDYRRFLAPLPIVHGDVAYSGRRAPEEVPPEMWDVFEQVRTVAEHGDLTPAEGLRP